LAIKLSKVRYGDIRIARRIANTLFGALVAYAGYVLLLPMLLRLLGWHDVAAAVDWHGIVVVDPDINYPAIYTLVLMFGIAALLAINWDQAISMVRLYRESHTRVWSWSAVDAIAFIALDTTVGTGLNDRDRILRAIDAFNEFARRGRIAVAGRKPGSAEVRPIPRRIWRDARLDFDSIADARRGTGGKMVRGGSDTAEVLYEGLLVDKRQLFAAWPRAQRGAPRIERRRPATNQRPNQIPASGDRRREPPRNPVREPGSRPR